MTFKVHQKYSNNLIENYNIKNDETFFSVSMMENLWRVTIAENSALQTSQTIQSTKKTNPCENKFPQR